MTPEIIVAIAFVSLLLGSYVTFVIGEPRKGLPKTKKGLLGFYGFLQVLFKDFRFQHFAIRRFAGLVYFLCVVLAISGAIFFAAYLYENATLSLIMIPASFFFLFLARIFLELVIAVVSIAENTSSLRKQ